MDNESIPLSPFNLQPPVFYILGAASGAAEYLPQTKQISPKNAEKCAFLGDIAIISENYLLRRLIPTRWRVFGFVDM